MKTWQVFAAILLLGMTCLQVAVASCSLSSVRIGQQLIKTGDADRRVLDAAPDRTVRLESREGGAAGYRYEFHERQRTIHIYARGGRVTQICRSSH